MDKNNLPIVQQPFDTNNLIASHQSNNIVNGGMAGQNLYNITLNLPEKKTPLRVLAETFKKEVEADPAKKEFIEDLQNYMKIVPYGTQRDLKTKLTDSQRDDLIAEAEYLKEQINKKLFKYAYSETAQNLFVQIFSKINSTFKSIIIPMISENKSRSDVDAKIYSGIIEKIHNEIGVSELSINTEDIRGMLFYLAGNCHIKWDNK